MQNNNISNAIKDADTPKITTNVDITPTETSMFKDTKINDTTGLGQSLSSSIDNEQKQRDVLSEEQRLVNIDNSSSVDKYFTLSNTFDGTDVGGVIDYFKYDRGILRPKDEKFISSFDKQLEDIIMQSYNLPESSRPYIQEAKNYEHLQDLAEKEQLRNTSLQKVMNTYTDAQMVASNLAVSLATDPTILLTGGATALVIGSSALVRGINAEAKVSEVLSTANKGMYARDALNTARIGKESSALSSSKDISTATSSKDFTSGTITSLENKAKVEAMLMVVDDMKKGLATGVMGSNIAYGAILGATQEDTSMIEGLLAYGLLSPIDYKIINGIKVLDRSPRTVGLGKNTVDDISNQSLRLERNSQSFEQPKMLNREKALQLENKIDASKTMSNIEKEELKQSIRARLRVSTNNGFKTMSKRASDISNQIKKLEAKQTAKDVKLFEKSKKLRIVEKEIDDIHDLAKDIEMNIADTKKALEVISKTGKGSDNIGADILSIYKAMNADGHISNSAYKQLEYSYKKGKGKGFNKPKIELNAKEDTKTGKTFTEVKINGKIVKVLGASALAGSGLSAYDGGDAIGDAGAIVGLAILTGFLGVKTLHLLNESGVISAIRNGEKIVKKAKALDDTRDIRGKIGEFFNKSRVSAMETVQPILNNTTGAVKDLANILYFNPLDQTVKTIETTKRIFSSSKAHGLEREIRPIYDEWLRSQDLSKVNDIASMFTDISLRAKYNKRVWEHMTMGNHRDDINVVNGAKKTSEYFDQVRSDLIESGVKNADKMFSVTDNLYYVPRIHNGLDFANKITGITEASKAALIDRFASMLTKTPEERRLAVAESYINNMIKRDLKSSKTISKDSREALAKELKTKGMSDDEIEEVISTISGEYGRTKARLHMDYSKFGRLDAEINGVSVPITIDDIFLTDITSASNTLFNQAGGHIAFATNGFKSIDDAISIIKDANMLESHRTVMMNDVMATIGTPAIDYSQTANIVFKNLGNMATGKMMTLSTISLMSEGFVYMANTIRQAGVFEGMKNLTKSVRGFGDDSFIASDIPFGKDGLGLGQSKYSGTYGQFRTFDEFSNQNSGLGNFTKYSEMWRDFTLHTLPFSRTSDFIAKANMQDVLDRLHKHISGEMPFKEYELSAFPISDRMKKYLSSNLKLNKEGHVKFFDYTKESFDMKDEFKNLIDNVMMKRMNQTTMGSSAAFVRQSAVGVGMSSMLKYPMSAYANLGGFLGRGALQGDSFAMVQVALWFQAGIVQAMIRNEIKGREYDDNDLIVAGLMNMPQYGILGTITGLGSSPTADMASRMTGVLDVYKYVNSGNR